MEPKITQVRKRDKTIVDFDQSRIEEAIYKAITATGQGDGEISKTLSLQVVKLLNRRFKKDDIPTVEEIQDVVEEVLILEELVDTAKAYILYREQRRRIREATLLFDESTEAVDKYLQELDWQVKENANMAYSLQGLNQYSVSSVAKKYWLNKIYPKEVREAALNEDFHIHNLDTIAPYCEGWDLYDLLLRGFGGVPGKIECRPPKHLRSALGQLVNFFFTLQGESAGANAVSSFDTLLAPFIRYDNLSYPQVKQAMQEFLYNCMVPTRVGFQTPFLNVSLDIIVPSFYKDQAILIGGLPQKDNYGDFQEEMNMLNKAFYEFMMEGDAKNRPFTFPIPTVSITKDFDWDNPVLDTMWEATAKYGVNYFSNFVQSDMKPEDVKSMCLKANEEIVIREKGSIKRMNIKEVAEVYRQEDFDEEGWADCGEDKIEALSLNPSSLKLEWTPVMRFLKVEGREEIEVVCADGKKAAFSAEHPMAVYTQAGIKMKFAKDIEKGDFLMSAKKTGDGVLASEYQNIGDLILNEDLAKFLGYFVADGNYLFKTTKDGVRRPRGLQFTFKSGDEKNLGAIKGLAQKIFGLPGREKQDPRYNSYYLYINNTVLAEKLYGAGFKKYGRLPQILFNSPASVIKSFLEFHFLGDGYQKEKEIHLNDLELSRDLVLLYSLVDRPVTYKVRKNSQVIRLQHAGAELKIGSGQMNNPILAERVPGWMALSTYAVPGLVKSRTVGLKTLEKYWASTQESQKIKNSDIYLVRVEDIKVKHPNRPVEFYDIELKTNHLFVHSLGQISFNCCRLRLDKRELYKRGGGLFGSQPLTGSIGVVTINMPRIGYLSKTKKEFFERLGHLMDLAKESLEIKRKALENFMEKGLYPYSKYYLEGVKRIRGAYFGNHFSTIGLLGMNEALLNFLEENISTLKGRKFTLEVLDFMRDRLVRYQEETGSLYNLEATPAEGTSYRQAKADKEKYPKIITSGTAEVPYYTNSTMLPVNYTDDVFEALKLQDEIQSKYTGGVVLHIFIGERLSDIQSVKNLVKKVFDNFHLPYITITPTFSICPAHGYLAGEHFECPQCVIKQPCEVYSRVVGYLRPVQQWHKGKKQEFQDRKEFVVAAASEE